MLPAAAFLVVVTFLVVPLPDEPGFDMTSMLDKRMTIFPGPGGLDRRARLIVRRGPAQ